MEDDKVDISELNSAENFYLSQDYEMAVDSYVRLCEEYPDNPLIMLNAGNAQYKSQNYGSALAKYYQAKAIIPRNKELNNNLSLVLDDIKLNQPPLLSYSLFNYTESLIIFLLFNVVFLVRKRLSHNNLVRFIMTAFFILATTNLFFILWEQKFQRYAVIAQSSVKARSGDNDSYSELFELLDGQIVNVLRKEESWSKIKTKKDLGWVKNEDLEFI